MYAKLVLFWALAVQLAWSQTVSLSVREAMHLAARRLPSVQAAQALLEGAQAYAQSIGAQPNPYLRLSGVAGQPPEEAKALVFRFDIAGQPQLRELSAQEEVKAR